MEASGSVTSASGASTGSNQELIEVGYWSIRGLAAPLRMMCMHAKVPLKAQNYTVTRGEDGNWDRSSWFGVKAGLKSRNPFMNLPYVIDGDHVVSQSNACLAYLGRRLGLWPLAGSKEENECEQALCEIMDLRNKMISFAYGNKGAAGAKIILADVTSVGGSFEKFELWLNDFVVGTYRHSGLYLVADKPTAPDFHLWEMLDQYRMVAEFYKEPNPMQGFPRLTAFYAAFAAHPNNTSYLSSPLHQLPCNNTSAQSFGATPNGSAWSEGQECTWANTSGEYR